MSKIPSKREAIEDQGMEAPVFLNEKYDKAIVGSIFESVNDADEGLVLYSNTKLVENGVLKAELDKIPLRHRVHLETDPAILAETFKRFNLRTFGGGMGEEYEYAIVGVILDTVECEDLNTGEEGVYLRVMYDYNKMVEGLAQLYLQSAIDGKDPVNDKGQFIDESGDVIDFPSEALSWISYNTFGALANGKKAAPVIVNLL